MKVKSENKYRDTSAIEEEKFKFLDSKKRKYDVEGRAYSFEVHMWRSRGRKVRGKGNGWRGGSGEEATTVSFCSVF